MCGRSASSENPRLQRTKRVGAAHSRWAAPSGEQVWFVNGSGGMALVPFAGSGAARSWVGRRHCEVRFEAPGTYGYTVHVSGVKVHGPTGTIEVTGR